MGSASSKKLVHADIVPYNYTAFYDCIHLETYSGQLDDYLIVCLDKDDFKDKWIDIIKSIKKLSFSYDGNETDPKKFYKQNDKYCAQIKKEGCWCDDDVYGEEVYKLNEIWVDGKKYEVK